MRTYIVSEFTVDFKKNIAFKKNKHADRKIGILEGKVHFKEIDNGKIRNLV